MPKLSPRQVEYSKIGIKHHYCDDIHLTNWLNKQGGQGWVLVGSLVEEEQSDIGYYITYGYFYRIIEKVA
ncbi:MAG: hypothetical protein KAS15_06025 [Nanoarchaeota archaeon]|nr:hypothetical protein [Nanoarchaeota archaeon]